MLCLLLIQQPNSYASFPLVLKQFWEHLVDHEKI